MRKHFISVFITIFTMFFGLQGQALARNASHLGWTGESPQPNDTWSSQYGTASYYGPGWNGRKSASGVVFDQRLLTAAHQWLPFGTRVKVTLGGSTRSVIVTITDRLYSNSRIVDLSVAAAQELGMIQRGLAPVTLAPA